MVWTAFGRPQAGQAVVELALSLPILVLGLLGGAEFARVYATQQAVENAARAGAEAYVIRSAANASQVQARAQQDMNSTPGLNPAAASVAVTFPTIGGVGYVTVRVQYTFRTIVAWPWIPNTANIDRTVTMRVFP